MTDTIELAEKLGKAIADSPEATKLRDAKTDMEADSELMQVMKESREHSDKMAALERENKPIEVEDKHKLQELHGKLVASDVFKKYTAAQVEYVDLMRKIDTAMRTQLTDTEKT